MALILKVFKFANAVVMILLIAASLFSWVAELRGLPPPQFGWSDVGIRFLLVFLVLRQLQREVQG